MSPDPSSSRQRRESARALQPDILRLQLPGVRDVYPAKLRLPLLERGPSDSMAAAHITRRLVALLLGQNPDDLLFREP